MRRTCTCNVQCNFATSDFAPDFEGTGLPDAVKRGLSVTVYMYVSLAKKC